MIEKLKELGNNILNIKQKSMLADISLEILTEYSKATKVALTNRRVEKGFNISDTARKEPMSFNITAMDNSVDREINRLKLYKISDLAEFTTFYYAGRDLYENIVIESIEEKEEKEYKNCYIYYILLKQIQTAEIKAEDAEVSYKEANTTGGNKSRVGANIGNVNNNSQKIVQREKSGLKTIFGG